MKRVLRHLAWLVLVGCHEGPPCEGTCGPRDSGSSLFTLCELLSSACDSGQKCTFYPGARGGGGAGECAPDGTVLAGGACTYGPAGETTGYDDCVSGLWCDDGECKPLCDRLGGAASCAAGDACQTMGGVFAGGPSPSVVGVCEHACDPLADNDFLGSGTRPGTACAAGQGCYGYPAFAGPTTWTCQRERNPTLVHGSPCTLDNGCAQPSDVYLDGCAQGYVPLATGQLGSTEVVCVALCAPGNTYAGNAGTQFPAGQPPHTCTNADARGTFDTGPDGDQCTYSWWFERYQQGAAFVRSPTSNTVGLCVDHATHRYDSNHDGIVDGNDATWPACASLPDGAGSGSALGAADFGCVDTMHAGLAAPLP